MLRNMLSEDLKCFTGEECKGWYNCPRGCFCNSDDRNPFWAEEKYDRPFRRVNCRSCHQAVEDCRLIPCPQGCECDEKTYRCEGWTDEDDPRFPEVYRSRRDILREDANAYSDAVRYQIIHDTPGLTINEFNQIYAQFMELQEEEKISFIDEVILPREIQAFREQYPLSFVLGPPPPRDQRDAEEEEEEFDWDAAPLRRRDFPLVDRPNFALAPPPPPQPPQPLPPRIRRRRRLVDRPNFLL